MKREAGYLQDAGKFPVCGMRRTSFGEIPTQEGMPPLAVADKNLVMEPGYRGRRCKIRMIFSHFENYSFEYSHFKKQTIFEVAGIQIIN